MILLVTTWFGIFLYENQRVIKHILFPKKPIDIANRLKSIENGEILGEEKELAKDIKEDFFVTDKRLRKLGPFTTTPRDINFIKPEDYHFSQEMLHDAMIELGKMKSREAISVDEHLIQAVNTIDDLVQTSNLLSERLHEWYNIHFPELSMIVKKEEDFVKLISEDQAREELSKILKLDTKSIGSEISPEDKKAIISLAKSLQKIYSTRVELENYIKSRMENVAPNITKITGPIIGARLLAHSHGLEKLASMPASTIQLLGAEDALFKHLRKGVRPPKHGIIFQHPYVHNAPYWQRGKIARSMASKIAIAARIDYYQGKFIGDELEKKLMGRVEEIRRKYPTKGEKQTKRE